MKKNYDDYEYLHKTGKKKGYKTNRKSRAKTSYETYLANRQKLSQRYTLDTAMSEETFKEEFQIAKLKGEKNIAREFAKSDRIVTLKRAKRLEALALEHGVQITAKDIRNFRGKGIPISYKNKAGEEKTRIQTDKEALFLYFRDVVGISEEDWANTY